MALITRYFSTAAAGAGDGTTWADRAILFTGGAWSAVITGFAFNGSDSLLCLVGPGTYTTTYSLTSASWANPPSVANPITFHGCDSSGNPLTPPDPDWQSCEPDWDASGLPVINHNNNTAVITEIDCICRLINFTSTVRIGGALASGIWLHDWCFIDNAASGTSASGSSGTNNTNCIVKCSGTSYNYVLSIGARAQNCRVYPGGTATSGNRGGIVLAASSSQVIKCTSFGHAGKGIPASSTATSFNGMLFSNVVADNGGKGIELPSTGSIAAQSVVSKNMVTGNVTGLDAQSATPAAVVENRLRDNGGTNITGTANQLVIGNYETDSDDASEYVDGDNATLSLRDYTIKAGSTIHGMGFGVAEQAASGGSVFPVLGPSIIHPGRAA